MRAFWHPVSAVFLDGPRMLASPTALRMLLAGEGRVEVVYAGDRMWPAIRHGEALVVSPVSAPAQGDIVLASEGGVLDVLRLAAAGREPTVIADADPAPPRPLGPTDLFGRIDRAPKRRMHNRPLARLLLDVIEATRRAPDPAVDRAQTVRDKYDEQAVHYDRVQTAALPPELAARIQSHVARGARVLVAGSGVGRETFEIEALGYDVSGVDFAPRMVELANAAAARRGSAATFTAADLRHLEQPAGSLGAVFFTYDVFSFVPGRHERTALLARLRSWLTSGGVLFLSARRTESTWARALLSLQWLARLARGRPAAWGDSHARRLDAVGNLKRSYVHVFTDGRLDREAAAAGFTRLSWDGGHGVFVPRR